MALQLLQLSRSLRKLSIATRCSSKVLCENAENHLPKIEVMFGSSSRNSTNFFNRLPANDLWKGVTTVSNAGKKRGRGRTISKKLIKDLNRGQVIGVGKVNMLWPGLTAPVIRGKELVQQQRLPDDPEREKKLIEIRSKMGGHRRMKLSPIERGWTGSKLPGRSIGAPDAVGEETFEGFDTRVLELKTVFNMKGNFGRKRRQASMVAVGNYNGLVGFSIGKAIDGQSALRKAKNRAVQKLMYIPIFRGHTVFHDFFTQFGATKIYVYQKPEGYGLKCHRVIKTLCEIIGIKNLAAKVEGSTNVNSIVKAFLLGLIRQKTHEQMAKEKNLHLVEMRKENHNFPNVLASPTKCRKSEEVDKSEVLDWTQYCFDGKVIYQKKKYPPFYSTYYSYMIHMKKKEKQRSQQDVKLNLLARYGEIRSFLTDKYPECRPAPPFNKKKQGEEEEEVEA